MKKLKIKSLLQRLDRKKHIILYGAGFFAKEIIDELRIHKLEPEFCVVTDKADIRNHVSDIPIYSISECDDLLRKEDSIVLIAVAETYHEEIEDTLYSYNITEFISVTDYVWTFLTKDSYEKIYKYKPIEWYLDGIIEWGEENFNEDWRFEADKDTIAFCVTMLEPRVVRIASELKRKGKQVIVLLQKQSMTPAYKSFLNDLLKNCSVLYYWEYAEEFLYLVLRERVAIVHVFSNVMNPFIACILVQLKIESFKVVFENYDIANGMYKYEYLDKYFHDLERFCLENADGICCRGYEIDYLIDNLGFQIKGKVIKFFDYCSNEECIELEKSEDRPLSLCYAGTFTMEEEGTGASHACYSDLIKLCKKNKCHLHVYPVNWDEVKFKRYIELDSNNEYFHFHKPVSYSMLRTELAQYDYGILGEKQEYIEKNTDKRLTPNKYVYAATNKYFTYLEAGLPVIAKGPEKLLQLFEERNVLLRWTIEEYDFSEMILKRDEMHENAVLARKDLAIENRIDELLDFYDLL